MQPFDPYFTSKASKTRAKARATSGESDAMSIGRDDYRAYEFSCPFEAGSEDAGQWMLGQRMESDGK